MVCEDPRQVEGWNLGLRLVDARSEAEVPECLWPRLPLPLRAQLRVLGRCLPKMKKVYQLCVFQRP